MYFAVSFFLRVLSSPLHPLLLLSLPCCCINFHINSYSLWLIIGVVIIIAVVIVLPRPPSPHCGFAALFIQNNLNRHYLCIQLAFSTQTPHVEHSNPNPRPNPQPNPHPNPNSSCHSPHVFVQHLQILWDSYLLFICILMRCTYAY